MLIGLDIGGTKIEGVALDLNSLEQVDKFRLATARTSYLDFFSVTCEVIDKISKSSKISAIGIGCCGSLDSDKKMQGANIEILNGMPFLADLEKKYQVPVTIANDADCFALSEFKDGAAKDAKSSCAAVIIGTGCGAGLIANGDIYTGVNNLAGEIGHNPLPHFSPEKDGDHVTCYCGNQNCIESFVSGTGFARTFSEKHAPLDAKSIMQRYRQGDAQATEHFELYCDQLARVCAYIVNFFDPEVIVLGGGMSNVDEIYPLVNNSMHPYLFNKKAQVKVVKNSHGDSSGVRGAALLNSK